MAAIPHLEIERDIVELQGQIEKLRSAANAKGIDVSDEVVVLTEKLEAQREDLAERAPAREFRTGRRRSSIQGRGGCSLFAQRRASRSAGLCAAFKATSRSMVPCRTRSRR